MRVLPITLTLVLFASPAFAGGPRSTWKKYVAAVSKRDDLGVLACYASPFRRHVSSHEGRLQAHFDDVYGLVARDYAIKVGRARRAGTRSLLSLKFTHKTNDEANFQTEVPFIKEGRDWLIEKPPEPLVKPSYWERRLRSLADLGLPLYLGIAAGGLLVLATVRKLMVES